MMNFFQAAPKDLGHQFSAPNYAYVKMVVVTLSVGVLATTDGTSVQEAIFILFLKVCEIIFFKTCFKIFLTADFECLLKIAKILMSDFYIKTV